jgi:phage shock protein E
MFRVIRNMFEFLKNIFKSKPAVSLDEVIGRGAVIIDVRTEGEYRQDHLKKSINIPIDRLESKIPKLDKSKPIITCCASGMRSASAKRFLKASGFTEVYNGGSWTSLKKYEK